MSVSIKYKGAEIASADTEVTKTIKTSGKYCEADIIVENTPDGGITPTGNINITDTNVTDVTNYATAQVVDADLVASNIKKDVNILGVVGSFEGGGAEITDGIIIKARDASGYATEVDYYGDTLYVEQFSSGYPDNVGFRFLTTINFKNEIKHLQNGFAYNRGSLTTLNGLDFSKIETSGGAPFDRMVNVNFGDVEWLNTTFPSEVNGVFYGCKGLTKLKINLNSWHVGDFFVGNCTNLTDLIITGNVVMYGQNYGQYAPFYNCTSLKNVSLGNVGTAITNFGSMCFNGCTQSDLTITAYTRGTYADTLLSNIRKGATHATIIIKASEATTYGGVSYAAGDTMITSEAA